MDRILYKTHFFDAAVSVSSLNVFRGELTLQGNLALLRILQRKYLREIKLAFVCVSPCRYAATSCVIDHSETNICVCTLAGMINWPISI